MTNPIPTIEFTRPADPRRVEPTPPRRPPWKIALAVVLVAAMLATTGVGALRYVEQRQDDESRNGLTIVNPAEGDLASAGDGVAQGTDNGPDAVGGDKLPEPDAGVAPIEDAVVVNDDGQAEAEGDLAIDVGAGAFVLSNADVVVSQDADGAYTQIESGTASMELPTVGPLSETFIDRPLRGAVGMATGAELASIGAHLRPEKLYFYADLGAQPFQLFLDLDDTFEGAAGLPEQVSTVGMTGAAMFVADIEGDYFYLSVPCEAMVPAGEGSGNRTTKSNEYADEDSSAIPGISLDLSAFDPGGCGLGWSAAGVIPFAPLVTERFVDFPDDFTAHLVVDGTIPVNPAASVDGDVFFNFGTEAASMWANGELDIGVSMLKGAVEISLPAGRGTFGMKSTDRSFDMWVTANMGEGAQEGTPVEILADIAPMSGRLDLDGELHIVDGEVQANSFFQLSGSARLGLGPLAALSGSQLDDIANIEAMIRIDAVGVAVTGSAQVSPVSSLGIDGSATLDFLVPFADPAESYLAIEGQLAIGAVDLGAEASLRIDKSGVLARGDLQIGTMAAVAVEGRIGPGGFQLTGSAEATLPIGDLDKVAANLIDTTGNDEVIRRINAAIDQRIDEIAGANSAKAAELRNTFADFRGSFETIAGARANIAYNDGLIADLWDRHQADIDWHWALNDVDRFFDKGPHAIRLAAIIIEIEALKLANTTQYGYIDVANLTVSAVQQGVIAIIGWDEELNALMSLQTEAYVSTLAGNFVATVLKGADAILDAFGIDGSAKGLVTFTVGTEGVGATVDLQWCRDGSCQTLAGAVVDLTDTPRVCGTFIGVEACVDL